MSAVESGEIRWVACEPTELCERDGCLLSAEVTVDLFDEDDSEQMRFCRFDAFTIMTFGVSEALDLRNYVPRRPAPKPRTDDSGKP